MSKLALALPLAALATAVACASSTALSQDAPVPVIFSTDTATGLSGGWVEGASDIDDGLAIAMALDLPNLDVLGVVVTFGNNLMEPEFAVAQRVVEGMGASVPVLRGAPRPLPEYQVQDHTGVAVDTACLNEGVTFMADAIAASDSPVTILAIGPLTDPACLALNRPDVTGNIERIVIIGGRERHQPLVISGQFVPDFNLAVDFPAVRYLLEETTIPMRFMTFSVTDSVLIPADDRQFLCDSALALAADFFCPAILPRNNMWSEMFGRDGFHPWDQNAVYVTAVPDAYHCEPASYALVDCTAADCAGHDPSDPSQLAMEPGQVWLTSDPSNTRIEACPAFASDEAKRAFERAVLDFAR
ncbi:MAG: nucleoside hydrolase [Pseudomonadota bacterium]